MASESLRCFAQLALIITSFLLQHRSLPSKNSLAILTRGPCNLIGPYFCFTIYQFHMAITMAAGIAIANTIVFRYLVIISNHMITVTHIYLLIFIGYIFPIIVTIIPFTGKWDFVVLRNLTRLDHSTYDLSVYGEYPGFYDAQNIQFLTATVILAIGVYGLPILTSVLTRKVLILIKYHQNMGLLVQTVYPLLAYIPSFTCYLYTQTTGEEILLSEHLILATASSPGLLDPLISFYFVVPYREAILYFLCPNKRPKRIVVAVSVTRSTTL
ncbi:unnamed protein product [Caenorhabditis angaria]|uniref:G protein-coupled receptor n=1 Tax=Caenorhabditis angaria TaxID=860376 RepID=A0A9P1IAY1_9PELO|nr:unnamed protein product [Caenorhabditis angaria]